MGHQDNWPKCERCGGRIYLHPETRKVCRGCELRGGPPETTPTASDDNNVSDAQRVKTYLASMTVEQRQWQITNLIGFNPSLAAQWRQWNDELTEPR